MPEVDDALGGEDMLESDAAGLDDELPLDGYADDEDDDELGGIDEDDELEEPGVVESSEDELVEPPLDMLPDDDPLLDGVPDAPMPPVVDEPVLPALDAPAASLDALAERVEPVLEVSPVDAQAPRTSDAAASVVIASDLMRMNPSPWKSGVCLPWHSRNAGGSFTVRVRTGAGRRCMQV